MAKRQENKGAYARLSNKARLQIIDELLIAPKRAQKAFYESDEFPRLISLFKRAARRQGGLDQDAINYGLGRPYPFTADEFRTTFEAVMDLAPGETQATRPNGFLRLTKAYEGLEFSVLIGQGSIYQVHPLQKPKKLEVA